MDERMYVHTSINKTTLLMAINFGCTTLLMAINFGCKLG